MQSFFGMVPKDSADIGPLIRTGGSLVSYRRRAGGGKRDAAEKAILEALDAVGAEYWQIGGTGNPDLLIRFRRRFYAGEVKTGNAKETDNQGAFEVWRTPDDVLKAIGCQLQGSADVASEFIEYLRPSPRSRGGRRCSIP